MLTIITKTPSVTSVEDQKFKICSDRDNQTFHMTTNFVKCSYLLKINIFSSLYQPHVLFYYSLNYLIIQFTVWVITTGIPIWILNINFWY